MTTADTGCTPRPTSTTSRSVSRASAWRACPTRSLGLDEAKPLDIRLEPGRDLPGRTASTASRAIRCRASASGHWHQPGIEGRSESGRRRGDPRHDARPVPVPGRGPRLCPMVVGRSVTEWNRRTIDATAGGWQRNFDYVDFNLVPRMKPVDDHDRASGHDDGPGRRPRRDSRSRQPPSMRP